MADITERDKPWQIKPNLYTWHNNSKGNREKNCFFGNLGYWPFKPLTFSFNGIWMWIVPTVHLIVHFIHIPNLWTVQQVNYKSTGATPPLNMHITLSNRRWKSALYTQTPCFSSNLMWWIAGPKHWQICDSPDTCTVCTVCIVCTLTLLVSP